MVLFNRTSTNGFMLYTVARKSLLYPFYLFNAILIKIAVPLFFMISGALLLSRDESIKKILKNRFLRIAVVLVASSAIAYIYSCLRLSPRELSLSEFVKILYTYHHTGALWYLYAYLAYLLMLPFLRKMARNMSNHEFIWLFLMFGAINLLQIVDFLLFKGEAEHYGGFSLFLTSSYVFYPLMGYFVEYRLEEKDFNVKALVGMVICSLASIIICCLMSHYRSTILNAWKEGECQTFFNTLIFILTITVYYVSKMWFMRHRVSERTRRILTILGDTTFGVYLIEEICRYETTPIFRLLKPQIHTLPACWVWIAVA